jgi:hypothetical protein
MSLRQCSIFRRAVASFWFAAMSAISMEAAVAQQVTGMLPAGGGVGPDGRLDQQSESVVVAAVFQALDQRAARLDNRLYVIFRLAPGTAAPSQPQGGFADPLVPQGAPVVSEGMMEITTFEPPTTSFFPIGSGTLLQGQASLRIFQYRIYPSGVGWQAPQLVMLHYWNWSGQIRNGQFDLALSNEFSGRFASPDALTEFVSSVFNVDPQSVSLQRPTEEDLNAVLQ